MIDKNDPRLGEDVTGDPQRDFRPGIYRHTKSGNLYSAVSLVFHHERQAPMVLYVSLRYGTPAVRPLYGWEGDPDAWLDRVNVDVPVPEPGDLPAGRKEVRPRFEWVCGVPMNTPLTAMVK